MKKLFITITILALTTILFADQKGEEIAKKNFNLKESNDSYSKSTMVLKNSRGDQKVRTIESYTKLTSEGTNSFIKFLSPADVKGSSFLTIAHKNTDDEQRLYLPALGKVRRISSSQKDGKFMGSDLYYFDMEDLDFEDYTYQYIKDETYENMDCYVVEYYPTDEDAPYFKEICWINKNDNFIYKIECYDKKKSDRLIKTIKFVNVKDHKGVLIPEGIVVENHSENHFTYLRRDEIKVNIGVPDSIFTVQNLTK